MRISFKMLENMCKEINEERGLQYEDKGYIYVSKSYDYYNLLEIAKQGSSAVRALETGTTKDIDYYLRYRI